MEKHSLSSNSELEVGSKGFPPIVYHWQGPYHRVPPRGGFLILKPVVHLAPDTGGSKRSNRTDSPRRLLSDHVCDLDSNPEVAEVSLPTSQVSTIDSNFMSRCVH